MLMFHEAAYKELLAAEGKFVKTVERRMNENLVECVCGELYMYAIFEGCKGIFVLPGQARVACPFCGSVEWVSIKAHSGDFFNATLGVE